MSTATHELILLLEALPDDKQKAVAEFARFLAAKVEDEKWESLIRDGKPRPKLEAFLQGAKAEPAEPLDFNRL
jgi:hypothetical protein